MNRAFDSQPRNWHDLWVNWIGLLPYIDAGEEPEGCCWIHGTTARVLESEYTKLESPYLPEIAAYIDGATTGSEIEPSIEALYFLGQRWNVVLDFLHSLSVGISGISQTIIPPSSLSSASIFKWLLSDWWNAHGVRRLVELELLRRNGYYDD